MTKQFNKKVFLTKFLLIIFLGIIVGVSLLFTPQIETFLGIGTKSSSFSTKDQIVGDLKVHYLNVGQGDCTFIELPDNTTVMIDASVSAYSDHIIDYVKALGVSQIDYFILTHSDNDHAGGARAVFDAFEIKNVYRPFQIAVEKADGNTRPISGEMLGDYFGLKSQVVGAVTTSDVVTASNASYQKFITSAYTETYTEGTQTKSAQVYVSNDGMTIGSGTDYTFEFFAPFIDTSYPAEFNYEETKTYGRPTKRYADDVANNSSPVILLEYQEKSFLFTGDANSKLENDVVNSLTSDERERFKDVDVMQAGHHGSRGSNGEEFLALVSPDYFVVSAGENNSYKHPHEEVLTRLDQITHSVSDYLLITFKSNDILFGFDSNNNLVYTANAGGSGKTIYYWQIALAIFAIGFVVIISVKITKNKKATAKRVVSKSKQVAKVYKNSQK